MELRSRKVQKPPLAASRPLRVKKQTPYVSIFDNRRSIRMVENLNKNIALRTKFCELRSTKKDKQQGYAHANANAREQTMVKREVRGANAHVRTHLCAMTGLTGVLA